MVSRIGNEWNKFLSKLKQLSYVDNESQCPFTEFVKTVKKFGG